MECSLCKNHQYVGKSEWSFNKRINTHRNDVCRPDGPPADKHFQLPNHNFNQHAKFTILEKLEKLPSNKQELRKTLEIKEDRWISRLRTIAPYGLNINYNYPQYISGIIV